ncbi:MULTISPECIES: hypothetical protein [Aerosakkonema]|uniref:hypothetical protein n=1 Tax=Aerosakkonema TaxID=1246629 RepID=UPI0035B6CA3B
MNTEEQARERMAHQRQESQHVQDAMLSRAESENNLAKSNTEEQARQQMAQQRQESQHVQDAMLSRAEAELGMASDSADSSQVQS